MLGRLIRALVSSGERAAPARPTLCGQCVRSWERALGRLGFTQRERRHVIAMYVRPLATGAVAMTPAEAAELDRLAAQLFAERER